LTIHNSFNHDEKGALLFVSNSTKAPPQSIAITPATGAKRVTDRFVKYPYPPNVASVYQKEIARLKQDIKAVKGPVFNLEKEPKKAAKHKFTGNSSTLMDYKNPEKVTGKTACKTEQPDSSNYNSKISEQQKGLKGAPVMVNHSLYKNQFLDWGAPEKPLVEKTPQYPFYSLPFRGKSEYKQRYQDDEDARVKSRPSQKRP